MVFYVDDSAVFTNEIKDVEDFGQKIKDVNEKITVWMNALYEKENQFISSDLLSFVAEKIDLYGINIHPPGDKSTISNIADSKEGEVYIHCIGRETSKTAFDINTSFSDEESRILLNKTGSILKVIWQQRIGTKNFWLKYWKKPHGKNCQASSLGMNNCWKSTKTK